MSDIRCSFSVDTPVGKVTDKESGRFALAHAVVFPLACGDEVRMVATDGRMLSVTRHEGTADRAYMVPGEALPAAGTVALNGSWQTTTGKGKKKTFITAETENPGRFPDVSKVMPSVQADDVFALRIDADMLAKLARAVDDEGHVTLLLPRHVPTNGVVETAIPVVGSEGVGVIMPLGGDADEVACCVHKLATEAYYVRDCWAEVQDQLAPVVADNA